MDVHNRRLVENVHPPDWVNPTPAGRYNLVVVGAGTAGLVSAAVAGSLGARVALVERGLMGGDCLNRGCVPSKAMIRAGRLAHEARRSREIGLGLPDERLPDFGAAMERMRAIRARISEADSAERFAREFGVDVFLGDARFTGRDRLAVGKAELCFRRAIVATGARAAAPPIEGLAEAGHLDNESVFRLTERPARLAVIGAGPIGCELAQTFQRLGSQVTLLEMGPRVLPREDREVAELVQAAFARDGLRLLAEARVRRVERKGGEKLLHLEREGGSETLAVDAVLVGVGRAPNVEGLGLERAGVRYDRRGGVAVDDRLRSSNPKVFAAGDVCMAWKFTHAAEAAAKIAVQNALLFRRLKLSKLVVPWCTYTDPEVAHVGLSAKEARERGLEVETVDVPMERSDRARTDGETEGLVRIHLAKGKDRILGATLVASHAGEMLTALTLAMKKGIGLGAFLDVIHPYPTQAEAIKAAATQHARRRLTPRVKRLFGAWMRLQR